jgi:hypothetical protein
MQKLPPVAAAERCHELDQERQIASSQGEPLPAGDGGRLREKPDEVRKTN